MKKLREIVPLYEEDLYETCTEDNFDRYVAQAHDMLSKLSKDLDKWVSLTKENNADSNYFDSYNIKLLSRNLEDSYDSLVSYIESAENTKKWRDKDQSAASSVRSY